MLKTIPPKGEGLKPGNWKLKEIKQQIFLDLFPENYPFNLANHHVVSKISKDNFSKKSSSQFVVLFLSISITCKGSFFLESFFNDEDFPLDPNQLRLGLFELHFLFLDF